MNSAYNQMPLDEQSRRLTKCVNRKQQKEIKRLIGGISTRPATFSAFMSKIFKSLTLIKNIITYSNDVFIQPQTEENFFKVLEKYHQTLIKENMKAAPDKSHIFLNRVNFLGHIIKSATIIPLKSGTHALFKLQSPSKKN